MMKSLPLIRPTLPLFSEIQALVQPSWEAGTITIGPTVKAFEEEVCRQTGTRHAIALSSCTAGLMLVPRALNLPLGSEVIVPSFTFAATAQALIWNGLIPVFCDCLPGTWTLDPEDVERNLSSKTTAICPVYTYGLPPDIDALLDIGKRNEIPVYFDSAQALGSTYHGNPAGGVGICEVFSLSPTKVITAMEGGLITTNDTPLAERLRSLRDYGKDPEGGEDMIHLGLSARMEELNAAVGLLSIRNCATLVKSRLAHIADYRDRLGSLPGCCAQVYPGDRTASGNYFVLFISNQAKLSRDEVYRELKERGIQTKRYFHPPVHEQTVFQRFPMRVSTRMTQTKKASSQGLALPLYSHMTDEERQHVCTHVEELLG
jgi:dTDP-4-amino-4,6-dideoxygalactose transaminase